MTTSTSRAGLAVGQIWQYRRRIEIEAADQFHQMSNNIVRAFGHCELSKLAMDSAHDEIKHATYCDAILAEYSTNDIKERPRLADRLGYRLGSDSLTTSQRTLFAAVALSCVTESMSTALLIEMQARAKVPVVCDVVHAILEDEISHSRLGWALLARVSRQEDVRWLEPYIPGMIRVAMAGGEGPVLSGENGEDLSTFGILPAFEARLIMNDTIENVILPGLRHFGTLPAPTRV